MIYTFYSYKGGVGRSMALANIAGAFHERGLRVLVVDWDLEAPGLEAYFTSGDRSELPALTNDLSRPGLMDLLLKYRSNFSKLQTSRATVASMAAVADTLAYRQEIEKGAARANKVLSDLPEHLRGPQIEDVPTELPAFLSWLYDSRGTTSAEFPGALASSPLRAYLQCMHNPEPERQNGLYLLSAGARAGEQFTAYAEAVQDFDWTELYASFEGREYFSWLRDQLSAVADVVLIDSRTGVTEMGGVCTRHLPDVVVSFCAPNRQNVDGVLRVMGGVNKEQVKKARGDRHVDVLIIPTRIDTFESDRLEQFRQKFAKQAEELSRIPEEFSDLPSPFWSLQIPYIPRYNYEEERVLGPDVPAPDAVGEKLAGPYRDIALFLAVLADPDRDPRVRKAFAGEIAARFPQLVGSVPQMARPVPAHFVGREAELGALKAAMLSPPGGPETFTVVTGPAGIGKSTLAARACHDLGIAAFPDGILWVTAADVATREHAYEWLRTTFGEKPIGERGLRERMKSRRFLIVVDDVRVGADVRHVCSFGEACSRVVVTRDVGLPPVQGSRVVVGPLTFSESQALLGFQAEAFAQAAGTQQDVLSDLVRWPLGASLMRAEIDRRTAQGQATEEISAGLRDVFGRHGIVAFDQPGIDRSTSVARTLRDVVYGETVPPLLRQLLLRIARRKDPSVIPDAPSSVQDLASVRRLTNLGLVARDTATGLVTVHPLVRAFLVSEGELDELGAAVSAERHVSSSEDQKRESNPQVERAKAILRGATAELDEIERLGDQLRDSRYFGYARQLFSRARRHPELRVASPKRQLKLTQRHALCTYKDNDLPGDERFGEALEILAEGDLNAEEPSQETLGLAGAIYKNKWRLAGRRRDLERSAALYMRGHMQGVEADFGYTGINAAFVHDLIASQLRQEAPGDAEVHAATARKIRTSIVKELPLIVQQKQHEWVRSQWWFYATMAEACFGLVRQDEARYWIREGLPMRPPDWQLESVTRQLAELANAQQQPMEPDSSAWHTLRLLVGHAGEALRAITLGKVGLALSGGGFRASLFHIGVLAHLAEADLLRHVEVLSCVSGGSIVGAHYYLEVRKLLNETPDGEITREHYVQIVKRIEKEFLEAVQKNLRTRLFASIVANVRTLFDSSYTRTAFLGHLFERHIYSRVKDDGSRNLDELIIKPADSERFNPKLDNWRRAAKGPVLLLNATTLNTGHNWQFAVSWMGEPPLGASSPVDRNDVLRRLYYWEAPPGHRKVPLGRAVAASACVPALFDPIEMKDLFPRQIVRLVDGGVHDNQGIVGLLEQDCTMMIVSDASGQTNLIERPSGEVTSVPLRANDILMGRVREAEFRELELLRRSSAIRGLMFLHLKKDLDVMQLDWVKSQDPWTPPDESRVPNTSYGIPKTVQRLLAGVRTDLDSFTDKEAYALMLSGYEMASAELRAALPSWPDARDRREEWRFKAIEPAAKRATGHDLEHADLLRQLGASGSRSGKIWKLSPAMRLTAVILLLTAVAAGVWFRRVWIPIVPWKVLGWAGTGYLLTALAAWLGHFATRTGKSLTVILTALVMVPVGAIAAAIHLVLFDPLFLLEGSIDGAGKERAVRRLALALLLLVLAVVAGASQTSWLRSLARVPTASVPQPSGTATAGVLAQARAAQSARDYTSAIPLWTQVLTASPASTEALSSRAHAYMQRGEIELAIVDYTAALAIRREPDWFRARAYAYKLVDRLDESRSDLTAVLSLERDERTLNDLRYLDYLENSRRGETRPSARIYVMLAEALQEVGLDYVRRGLPEAVLIRPPAASRTPPDTTELRYVYDDDMKEANDIAKRITRLGLQVNRVVKTAPGRSRPRHFELWLAREPSGARAN
jgi:predicted acylesterase/phospholipase RssA/tetratricopeptide (TPR) repeat protein